MWLVFTSLPDDDVLELVASGDDGILAGEVVSDGVAILVYAPADSNSSASTS